MFGWTVGLLEMYCLVLEQEGCMVQKENKCEKSASILQDVCLYLIMARRKLIEFIIYLLSKVVIKNITYL